MRNYKRKEKLYKRQVYDGAFYRWKYLTLEELEAEEKEKCRESVFDGAFYRWKVTTEKECKHCGKVKPLSEFYHSVKGKYNRDSKCKECCKKDYKEYIHLLRKDPVSKWKGKVRWFMKHKNMSPKEANIEIEIQKRIRSAKKIKRIADELGIRISDYANRNETREQLDERYHRRFEELLSELQRETVSDSPTGND